MIWKMPLKASIGFIKIVSVLEIDSWFTLYELEKCKVHIWGQWSVGELTSLLVVNKNNIGRWMIRT
jgi:hypothetical protein